jgi:hypothetical protein
MPIVELCFYCKEILDTANESCVEISKETKTRSRILAHVECKQQHASQPAPRMVPGSWMSR